jgi:transcriptional regulator with XRE-family HTH domain
MSTVVVVWTLGDRLAKSRRVAGISREEMAAYLGMSPQAVSNYEGDRRAPKLTVLRSWATRTRIDLDWLRYGDTTPLPEVVGRASDLPVTDNKKYVGRGRRPSGSGAETHSYRRHPLTVAILPLAAVTAITPGGTTRRAA